MALAIHPVAHSLPDVPPGNRVVFLRVVLRPVDRPPPTAGGHFC